MHRFVLGSQLVPNGFPAGPQLIPKMRFWLQLTNNEGLGDLDRLNPAMVPPMRGGGEICILLPTKG